MTLVSSIISDGYRELNQIAIGKSPSSNQETEGLRLLQAIFLSMLGSDAGEILHDWPLGDYGRQTPDQEKRSAIEIANPPINSRLLHTAEAAMTLFMPANPCDGSRVALVDPHSRLAAYNVTLNPNGRTIEAAATLVLATNGLNRQWLYRADLGDWVRITDLDPAEEMPFPAEFDNLFMILLAMRLSPRYGHALTKETLATLKQQRRDFLARYLQAGDLAYNDDLDSQFMSRQTFGRGYSTSTDTFNRGH